MTQNNLPPNEKERLQALRDYNVLDSLPEKAYDDIVKIAAQITDTPAALISLVDENRCWFKAQLNIEGSEAPRDTAFASRVVLNPDEPFIVEDAAADARFSDTPFVTGTPSMRFYAGTPLVNEDKHVVGSLCVIDYKPRKLTPEQIATLKTLAEQVVAQFELKKRIKEVEYLNDRLEKSNAEMESFSYTVSHDLKSPLRTIKGFSEIFAEDYEDKVDAEGKKILSRITGAVDKMGGLIEDILALSRLGRSEMKKENLHISEMTAAWFRDADLPEKYSVKVADGLQLHGDRGTTEAALHNLLENAVKYSSKEKNPQIIVEEIDFDGQKFISVRDNGTGFDMQYAKNIFRPFKRMHLEKEFPGTGIGLSLVKKVIDRHGGEIFYESEKGKGAHFWFRYG